MIRPRGFSLVELMVAITLALIVTIGVLAVFQGSRSNFQATSGTAALTDGGRFALDFIQNSVRNAGYMSCNTAARTNVSMLSPGATPLAFSFNEALGGFEATGTGPLGAFTVATPPVAADTSTSDWTLGLDAALAGQVVQNSDVLVVRSTLHNAQSVYVSSIANGASQFTVGSQGLLLANQLAVISDCQSSAAFQISGISGSGSNVVISFGTGGSPGNSTSTLPVSFSIGAQVTPVDTVVYYIGKGADGDGALFAWDLYNGGNTFTNNAFVPNELVPDIEAMQVLYGLDTTGSQTVSEYVTADQVPDFNTVMSVKVAVLAASAPGSVPVPKTAVTYSLLGTTVTAPMDTRSRQVFEITIAVRNSLP